MLWNEWLLKSTVFCKCDSPFTTVGREIKAAEVSRFWCSLKKRHEIRSRTWQYRVNHSVADDWWKTVKPVWDVFPFSYFLSFFFWVVKMPKCITGRRYILGTGPLTQEINYKTKKIRNSIKKSLSTWFESQIWTSPLTFIFLLFLGSQERISYATNF